MRLARRKKEAQEQTKKRYSIAGGLALAASIATILSLLSGESEAAPPLSSNSVFQTGDDGAVNIGKVGDQSPVTIGPPVGALGEQVAKVLDHARTMEELESLQRDLTSRRASLDNDTSNLHTALAGYRTTLAHTGKLMEQIATIDTDENAQKAVAALAQKLPGLLEPCTTHIELFEGIGFPLEDEKLAELNTQRARVQTMLSDEPANRNLLVRACQAIDNYGSLVSVRLGEALTLQSIRRRKQLDHESRALAEARLQLQRESKS